MEAIIFVLTVGTVLMVFATVAYFNQRHLKQPVPYIKDNVICLETERIKRQEKINVEHRKNNKKTS